MGKAEMGLTILDTVTQKSDTIDLFTTILSTHYTQGNTRMLQRSKTLLLTLLLAAFACVPLIGMDDKLPTPNITITSSQPTTAEQPAPTDIYKLCAQNLTTTNGQAPTAAQLKAAFQEAQQQYNEEATVQTIRNFKLYAQRDAQQKQLASLLQHALREELWTHLKISLITNARESSTSDSDHPAADLLAAVAQDLNKVRPTTEHTSLNIRQSCAEICSYLMRVSPPQFPPQSCFSQTSDSGDSDSAESEDEEDEESSQNGDGGSAKTSSHKDKWFTKSKNNAGQTGQMTRRHSAS